MYKAQSFLINENMKSNRALAENITISTVDAFQGNEMDIIIIATTRNTASDFLSNPNRINVAISRAKHHLMIVGNLEILNQIF